MSRNEIKRGEIYYITFAPVVGSEQHGGRPGIVVSNNMNNAHSQHHRGGLPDDTA